MKFNKLVSKQPRKKRLEAYTAPLHKKRKGLHIHFSKDLRKRYKHRSGLAKKGDKVKVLRGEFMKREAKIVEASLAEGKIFLEGVVAKRQGGKEMPAAIEPSNCMLVEWQEPKLKPKKARPAQQKAEEKKG